MYLPKLAVTALHIILISLSGFFVVLFCFVVAVLFRCWEGRSIINEVSQAILLIMWACFIVYVPFLSLVLNITHYSQLTQSNSTHSHYSENNSSFLFSVQVGRVMEGRIIKCQNRNIKSGMG